MMDVRCRIANLGIGCSLFFLSMMPVSAETNKIPKPAPAAIKALASLSPTAMGVDREDNLWAWNPGGALKIFSSAGEELLSEQIPSAQAVDYQSSWGIAWLEEHGETLGVLRPESQEKKALALPEAVGAIAWIATNRVAVTPLHGPAEIEIWDVEKGLRVAMWGEREMPPEEPGLVILPARLLRFDARRGLLHCLDAFSGRLESFDLEGRSVASRELPPKDRPGLAEWLKQEDLSARARGERREISLLTWPDFTVGDAGNLWVPTKCRGISEGEPTLELLALTADGARREQSFGGLSCCSTNLVLWGERLILYREPAHPEGACVQMFELPES